MINAYEKHLPSYDPARYSGTDKTQGFFNYIQRDFARLFWLGEKPPASEKIITRVKEILNETDSLEAAKTLLKERYNISISIQKLQDIVNYLSITSPVSLDTPLTDKKGNTYTYKDVLQAQTDLPTEQNIDDKINGWGEYIAAFKSVLVTEWKGQTFITPQPLFTNDCLLYTSPSPRD